MLNTFQHLTSLNYHSYLAREQMNFGTAYLDGSGIYGATPESADKLREFDGGFLKVKRERERERERQEVEITLECFYLHQKLSWGYEILVPLFS